MMAITEYNFKLHEASMALHNKSMFTVNRWVSFFAIVNEVNVHGLMK